ncbi:hypothetical protein FBY13_10410 [Pantoea sp. SJZ147]|uniref:hypothetical protein n=1 Tax=Pantoea allii TaxID=574096 RepID=UPI0011ABFE1F|nr:hypothetical protein [Pantoea allii]MDJ0088269.1 hypothetical protein [Pantoea allii]TWD41663.1 hypothetical protein FBY13_10410 [Pantoea sp. SJZ147]
MTRVAECVFRDKSNEDLYGLFHATLSGQVLLKATQALIIIAPQESAVEAISVSTDLVLTA